MIGGETVHVEPVVEPKETLADNSLAQAIRLEAYSKN